MNDKKEIIKLWSYILIFTTFINVVFFSFVFKVNDNFSWLISLIYPIIIWDFSALIFWILSFAIKYREITIENNKIEIYAGFINHYIKVNGKIKDEYKSSITITPINLSCLVNNHKISVVISTSNHITIKCDDELIK